MPTTLADQGGWVSVLGPLTQRHDLSENQAFRYGERAWGLQFHPEVDVPLWEGWKRNYEGAPAQVGLDQGALDAAIAAGSPALTEPLFSRFCSVCVAAAG